MQRLLLLVTLYLAEYNTATTNMASFKDTDDTSMNHSTQISLSRNLLFYTENKARLSLTSSSMETNKDDLLRDAISAIVRQHFIDCRLVLAFDAEFRDSVALESLVTMPHLKQVVEIQTAEDFYSLTWEPHYCTGYFFLLGLHGLDPTFRFMNEAEMPWNYLGKYVFVGLSEEVLDAITETKKGRKTHHIIGLVESGDELVVYMNQLFWGDGMTVANRWRRHGFTSDAEIFPEKVLDLRGAEIKLVSFEFEPHVILDGDEEGEGGKKYYGRDIKIAETLSEVLNFSMKIVISTEGEYWGSALGNGSWNGMMGVLERNEAHFGMACVFITNNGNMTNLVDLTRFYDSDESCFLIGNEAPLPKWQSLAMPFQLDTWLTFLLGLVAFCPILFILAKASGRREIDVFNYLGYSVLSSWGIHLRQSQSSVPLQMATQVWVVFLWLYAIVLTTGYSSNLTAFLTVDKPQKGIETIKDLHTSSLDVLGVGLFFKVSLEESDNTYLKELAERYIGLANMEDSQRPLTQGEAVFLETRSVHEYFTAAHFTRQGVSTVRVIKECYTLYHLSIALQKHLALKPSFDAILKNLFESGLMRKWYVDILQQVRKTTDEPKGETPIVTEETSSDSSGTIPLSLDHLLGIFYIHFFGLGVAILISFLEVSL